MPDEDIGTVTSWLNHLKAGDLAAAQPLWQHYFERLVRLARARLQAMNQRGADEDEEDAALSAFDSFCAGVAASRFPQLADRDDLWRLLVVITRRKVLDQAQRRMRQKRGGGRVVGESTLAGANLQGSGLDWVPARGPSPEFAAMVAEEFCRRLAGLGAEELRQVALLKMESYTNEEIAERLDCGLRTVARRLEEIRKAWSLGEPP